MSILPTIVGDDQVKLAVDINNSQPDGGSAVDGIPGVLKNSANTLVIVKNKQTAVIAGLIKQNKSNSSTGVPFLSDIPILGLLFKSKSVQDTNDELVIFLTPSIQDPKAYSVDPTVMSNLDNNAAKDIKGVEIKTERVPASVKEVTATTAVVPSGAVPAIAPPVTQEPVTVSVEKNKK